MGCATFWWLLPLLFQSRYGFDFLPFSEQAEQTTEMTSTVEVLRGIPDWLAHLHLTEPWLEAGWTLVANPVVIAAGVLITAVGLFGLARADLPHRRFLVLALLMGVAAVASGYGGVAGNPLAGGVRALLNGPLGMFRNVFKFQPLVSLPIAIGVAHGAGLLLAAVPRKLPSVAWRVLAAGALTATIALAALPLITLTGATSRGFERVPTWWTEFVAYHERTTPPGRALLVPGISTGDYVWGRPLDEPLNALTNTPLATRSLIPFGGPGQIRVLDVVEDAIARGGDPALGGFLRRAGFTTVVARNDLRWRFWDVPRPADVDSALRASGLVHDTSFGPTLPLDGDVHAEQAVLPAEERRLHALEVFRVPGSSAMVDTYPAKETVALSGGPEALLEVERAGLGQLPAVLTGDVQQPERSGGLSPDSWIVTDTLRRRWVDHGLSRDNVSYTLGAMEEESDKHRIREQLVPVPGVEHQSLAVLTGVASITASSYGSWLLKIPEAAPSRALDGDGSTAWTSGPTRSSVGEWWQVDFDAPIRTAFVDVQLLQDGPWRPRVRSLRVSTDAGELTTQVHADESTQRLAVPSGAARWLRITIDDVSGESENSAGVGIREVAIPGVSAELAVATPHELLGSRAGDQASTPSFLFTRLRTNPSSILRRDEETRLVRQFTLPHPETLRVAAHASPVLGDDLLRLVEPDSAIEVKASSTLQGSAAFHPRTMLDGDPTTKWVAAPSVAVNLNMPVAPGRDSTSAAGDTTGVARAGPLPQQIDPDPSISLSWKGNRTIDAMRVVAAPDYSKPTSVRITSPNGERVATLDASGNARFAPLETDSIRVEFPTIEPASGDGWLVGTTTQAPIGIAELAVPALADLAGRLSPPDTLIRVPRENGPTMSIGEQTVRFSITTSLESIQRSQSVTATPCPSAAGADPSRLRLPDGKLSLVTEDGASPFRLDTIALTDPDLTDPAPASKRSVEVTRWSTDERSVLVGPGDESLLVVNENFNRGWVASLGGRQLPVVRIDGWRQGFVVPEGAGGTVELSYPPNAGYRFILIAGWIFVLALVVGALWPKGRPDVLPSCDDAAPPRWLMFALVFVAGVWIAGLLALPVMVVLWHQDTWLRRRLPQLAFGSALLAAVVALTAPGARPIEQAGTFSTPAQVLAGLAVLIVAAAILPRRRPRVDGGDPRPSQSHLFAFATENDAPRNGVAASSVVSRVRSVYARIVGTVGRAVSDSPLSRGHSPAASTDDSRLRRPNAPAEPPDGGPVTLGSGPGAT